MTQDRNLSIEVSVQEVDQQRKSGEASFILLDCREPDEHQIAAISGSMLLPMSGWNEFEKYRPMLEGKHVIVHCHHGMRSLRVANWLRSNGFPDAQSMVGGIDAWSLEIDSAVPRY